MNVRKTYTNLSKCFHKVDSTVFIIDAESICSFKSLSPYRVPSPSHTYISNNINFLVIHGKHNCFSRDNLTRTVFHLCRRVNSLNQNHTKHKYDMANWLLLLTVSKFMVAILYTIYSRNNTLRAKTMK